MSSLHPGDALHRLLHAYKRAMREAYRAEQIALPISHVRALKGICHGRGTTVQAIAERMHRDKSQITRVVKELRAAGLVQSQTDPHDGRARLLTPTPEGRALMQRVTVVERRAGERMMHGLSPQAVAQFLALTEAMAANLDRPEIAP
ncbi:MarR family transcriptional regulator [Oleiagrimonas sp. C23AA]|uniref:MarR family winged helix-turn-helix transcriptional regulator n=1 Tax=Oleiagrimonas sp. C23AA TaxID=2719047 RepID=UPI00141F4B8B|nr:MarR family transcriptional regulator [Oleiagrimonas sp. C23AA]NII09880.1 MarR family transcriptional regulator [Oleiagrimonas sp. C23AA]